MHYKPNPRLTSESYVPLSVIITIISSGVLVDNSKGTATRNLRNPNVQEMYRILAHPAIPLLLFVMYHRLLATYQYI
jgi:hypothetical protein